MRAIGYSDFGAAGAVLALHDVALPEPAAGVVRVKLTDLERPMATRVWHGCEGDCYSIRTSGFAG